MASWTSTYKDSPADGDSPSQADDRIRELKGDIEDRIANEHVYHADGTGGASGDDWWHREGSAKGYYESSEPTNRPDGATALSSADAGRLWLDSDDGVLYVYTGSAWDAITAGTTVTDELASLTAAEVQQVQNIGATTISAAQWGYLGAATAYAGTLLDDADADTALGTLGLSTNLADLTDSEAAQLENIGATTISAAQWGYLGGLDQALTTTSNVEFGEITAGGAVEVGAYDFSVDTDTLYVDAANDRVGINTSSPTAGYALDVNGQVLINTGANMLDLKNTSAGQANYIQFIDSTGTRRGLIGFASAGDELTITNSTAGEGVGINKTPTAGYALDVNGDILTTGGLTFDTDNSVIGVNTSDGSDNEGLILTGGGAGTNSRGGTVSVFGNEDGNTGQVIVEAGDVSGGHVIFKTQNTERFRINYEGKMSTYGEINPDCSEGGLTLTSQASLGAEIITLKGTTATSPFTSIFETDTLAEINIRDARGLSIFGINDSGTADQALLLAGYTANGSPDSTTSTSGDGVVTLLARKTDGGTGVNSLGANENALVVKSGSTQFIVKGDGDIYYNGADQGAYDEEDDLSLVAAARHIGAGWEKKVLRENREKLNALGVITESGFVSNRKMAALQLGAINMLSNITKEIAKRVGMDECELMEAARGAE